MITLRCVLVSLTASFLSTGSLQAGMLTVTNNSFEQSTGYNGGGTSTIPGWDSQGGTFGAVTNSTSQFTSGLSGTNAVYLNGGISQLITGVTFVTGATYTFSLDIGNPSGVARNGSTLTFGFRTADNSGFIAGSGQLFVSAAQEDAIPDGTFQNFSLTYTAVAADNGNPVRIGMTDFFSSDTGYRLDNVTLATSVPEPSTYVSVFTGLAACALIFVRRRARS